MKENKKKEKGKREKGKGERKKEKEKRKKKNGEGGNESRVMLKWYVRVWRFFVDIFIEVKLFFWQYRIKARLRKIANDDAWLGDILERCGLTRQQRKRIEYKGKKYQITGNIIVAALRAQVKLKMWEARFWKAE